MLLLNWLFPVYCLRSTGEGQTQDRTKATSGELQQSIAPFCSQFNNNVDERSAELRRRADISPLSSAWNVIIQTREIALSVQGFSGKICTVLFSPSIAGCPLYKKDVLTINRNTSDVYNTRLWGGKIRLHSCYDEKNLFLNLFYMFCHTLPMFSYQDIYLMVQAINANERITLFWNERGKYCKFFPISEGTNLHFGCRCSFSGIWEY